MKEPESVEERPETYYREATARLRAALRTSHAILAKVPPTLDDLHWGTQIGNAWALVTTSYSGIEQSLKLRLAQRDGLTVSEWRRLKETKAKKLDRTHGALDLFDDLCDNDKRFLSEYYGRFQSLHSYISAPSLDQFLTEISSKGAIKSEGYQLWRYALVEIDNSVPQTGLDVMLAAWASLLELIEMASGRPQNIVMPDERLLEVLRKGCPDVILNMINAYDHPLNGIADIARRSSIGIMEPSELNEEVVKWLSEVSEDRDVDYLLRRARGHTVSGIGIEWRAKVNRFSAKPWTMPPIESIKKPEGLRAVYCQLGSNALRVALLMALYRSDTLSVAERMLDRERVVHSRLKWQCTLRAKFEGKTLLEVWQTYPGDDRLLHIKANEKLIDHVHKSDWKKVDLMGWRWK